MTLLDETTKTPSKACLIVQNDPKFRKSFVLDWIEKPDHAPVILIQFSITLIMIKGEPSFDRSDRVSYLTGSLLRPLLACTSPPDSIKQSLIKS